LLGSGSGWQSVSDDWSAARLRWADDGLQVFASRRDAEGYVEAIDVENGVWEGFWAVDGRVFEAEVEGNRVRLHSPTA